MYTRMIGEQGSVISLHGSRNVQLNEAGHGRGRRWDERGSTHA